MSTTLMTLAATTALMALASALVSVRVRTSASFYRGLDVSGEAPGVVALTLSQVTTWIFARSIMNAAILGYAFGIAGALAYAAYYLSFLTGGRIIDSLRFRHGYDSVQSFLADRFGPFGAWSYNIVVAVRLLSEIFANLIVIGLIFGADGSTAYLVSMLMVGLVTLGYAAIGGLNASIRTDVVQMAAFLVALAVLAAIAVSRGGFDVAPIVTSSGDIAGPGWVLLAVALTQIWSYPMHDPVMMDRGFIADRRTTRASFNLAAAISIVCILAFGLLGVWAGIAANDGEAMLAALTRLLGEWPMVLFSAALAISCMSTLDSTFSSSAKLAIVDMRIAAPSVANGRAAMALVFAGGMAMVALGPSDLFAAVAVSGTASVFLAPVVFFSLWGGKRDIALWAYVTAFVVAMVAAALYFTESSGYSDIIAPATGLTHKYSKLLVLSAGALLIGCAAFAAATRSRSSRADSIS